jgi:hypothetical protein
MARKTRKLSFQDTLEALRAQSFDVQPWAGVAEGVRVSKGAVAAVLVPGKTDEKWDSGGACLAVTPGIYVRGEIARLVDRGYQKFIQTAHYELPATADQLHAIHNFTEELNRVTGALGLYNEALGTTSDLYQYDRLRGREASKPAVPHPWDSGDGH